MANGPLGGFMPTPASPSQPPQVKLDTTALSRGTFNNFLKNMGGASTPPIMTAPSMGAINPLQMAPAFSDIDIFNPPMQMMAGGGNVAPRQTEIMGQPHMLAYITPEEGGILKALGGAGRPGPMGIPSFYETAEESEGTDAAGDPSAGVDGPSGEAGGGVSSDPSDSSPDDDSAPDDDMDYTDIDYGYTTPDETGKSDMQTATEIGRAVSEAQANAAEIQNRALAARNKQNIQTAINQNKANQQSLIDAQLGLAKGSTKGSTTPGAMPGGPPQGSGMTSNVVGASTTNFSNIGAKGLAEDPLGLSLQGVGLGPDIATPNIGPSVQSGPNTNADITGFGGKGGRDVSDFSTDIDALADIEEQAKKGSFPAFDKVPGFIGTVLGLVNQVTKSGAQNTLSNISKGFAPTYGKDGSITGTTGFGIGMGQPSSDVNMSGGLFGGGGKSVEGYDVFDDTSPSIGMYSEDRDIGGNESDPITLKRRVIPVEEEEKSDAPPSILGAAMPSGIGSAPFIVESPFTTNVGDFRGTGFDAGDLNALIAQITRQQLPRAMAKGGVARFANGGLIQAVDDFLSTGT
jgi:hypothetical protein